MSLFCPTVWPCSDVSNAERIVTQVLPLKSEVWWFADKAGPQEC